MHNDGSPDSDVIFILCSVFWGFGKQGRSTELSEFDNLMELIELVKRPDEVVFGGLSWAYHSDLRLYHAANDYTEPPAIASIVFIDLAKPGEDVVQDIHTARMYLPSAVFVLYATPAELQRTRGEVPQEWSTAFDHYYILQKPGDSRSSEFASVARRTLDQARLTAVRKRDDRLIKKQLLFISYSRADHIFAETLTYRLRTDAFDIWIDDRKLLGGVDWMDGIGTALDESEVLVLLVSPSALQSRHVKLEYRYFFNSAKPIIPVVVEAVEKLPAELATTQFIDFTKIDFELGYAKLRTSIARSMKDQ